MLTFIFSQLHKTIHHHAGFLFIPYDQVTYRASFEGASQKASGFGVVPSGLPDMDNAMLVPAQDARLQNLLPRNECDLYLCIPLSLRDEAGLLLLGFAGEHSPSETEIENARGFVQSASQAMLEALQFHLTHEDAQQYDSVREAALALTSSLDMETVLDAILKNIFQFRPDVNDIHLFLGDENHLVFTAAVWSGDKKEQPFSEPRKEGLTYTAARRKEAVVVESLHTHQMFENMPNDLCSSIIGLPLLFDEKVIGVMNIGFGEARSFTRRELHFLHLFRDQAAIAIENARLHALIKEQSRTDPLTGLLNRRAFEEKIHELSLAAGREGQAFSLILLDMDGFKTVNDTYGHPVGDQVLIHTAECFQTVLRQTDSSARLGGDEFALLFPHTDFVQAQTLAQRILQAFEEAQAKLPGVEPWPTFSMGLAAFPVHAADAETLLKLADQALYQSKSAGPGGITLASVS